MAASQGTTGAGSSSDAASNRGPENKYYVIVADGVASGMLEITELHFPAEDINLLQMMPSIRPQMLDAKSG
jgi:hypothetical protein